MRVYAFRAAVTTARSSALHHLHMADGAHRRAVARAHAGRPHDAHARAELLRQIGEQRLGARHRAGERVAHPHRDGRRRQLAFLHDIEMRIEGRDLVDFGLRQLHLGRERGEMRGREIAVVVLDEMQMLDQQVAPARPVVEQRAHLVERLKVDLAALRRAARAVLPLRTRRDRSAFARPCRAPLSSLDWNTTQVVDKEQGCNCHRYDRNNLSSHGRFDVTAALPSVRLIH